MQSGSNPLYPKFSELVNEIKGNPILERMVETLASEYSNYIEKQPRLAIRLALDSAEAEFHLLAKQTRERIYLLTKQARDKMHNSDQLSEALLYAAQEKISELQKEKLECRTNLESTTL